jgi:hypothetical protein
MVKCPNVLWLTAKCPTLTAVQKVKFPTLGIEQGVKYPEGRGGGANSINWLAHNK